MRFSWLAFALALPLFGCSSTADDSSSTNDAITAKAPALVASDFKSALNENVIRASYTDLSDAAFAAKWTASLASPVLFMRSYPASYHADLAQVSSEKVLGEEGICFGDAHPDNFGFIELGGQTRFVFNDLDDSGICPVGIDAARYFAVLRLYFGDDALTAEILQQYVDTVADPNKSVAINPSLVPNIETHRAKDLASSAANGKFVMSGDLAPPTADEVTALTALAKSNDVLSTYTLEDIASLSRAEGGSGGLRRYWFLASKNGVETILELKEAAKPGVDFGRQSRSLSMDERLGVLEPAFWGAQTQGDYYYVQVLQGRFLVRDRLTKKSVDFTKLADADRRNVLHTQASLMATVHAPHWVGVGSDDLKSWLSGTSQVLAERWTAAMKSAP